MATTIYSFGFRHGLTVDGSALIIDVRRILTKNPYHNKKLRALRGDHPDVIAELELTPGIGEAYDRIKTLVASHPGPVYIGCTGGHHRSVYIVNRLGADLGIPVSHLNYHDT